MKQREKQTRKKKKRNNDRSHDWKKKAPKPYEVLQRLLAKLNELVKVLQNERPRIIFLKNRSSNYWLQNVAQGWCFLKNYCIHRPKRIEAVWFHHCSCERQSWNEHKSENVVVLGSETFRGRGRNVNRTTGKAIQLILICILFHLNIWSCLNSELHRVQIKRCYFAYYVYSKKKLF